jgi:GYF domain 2
MQTDQFGEQDPQALKDRSLPATPTPMEWWYVHKGTKTGPVSVEQIKALSAHTFVWKAGMSDWAPLAQIFPPTSPPPIPAEEISEIAVWFWALSPLSYIFLYSIMVTAWGILLFLVINSIFYAWDLHLIRKSGRKIDLWGWFWFFVPIYLFVRASKLKVSNVYAWVWLILDGYALLTIMGRIIPVLPP